MMNMEADQRNPERDAGRAPVSLAPAKGPGEGLVLPDDAMILIPVRNMVLFPGMILPVTIGREASVAAAQQAVKSERPVGLLLQRDPTLNTPRPEELYEVGTVAQILRYVTTPDGTHHVIAQGEGRFRVVEFIEGHPFYVARVERVREPEVSGPEIEAGLMQLKSRAVEILQLLPTVPQEILAEVQNATSAAALADLVAGFLDVKAADKQQILETVDVRARIDRVLALMMGRIQVLKLSREIDERTKASVDERQREFMLREQMKTIQKELGEEEGAAAEIAELEKKIVDAKMPDEVEAHARKELKRLQRMNEASPEYSMARTYLDWLLDLPWS